MLSYAPPEVGAPVAIDTFERVSSCDVRKFGRTVKDQLLKSRSQSQVGTLIERLDELSSDLNGLYAVSDDWNAYGSSSPSSASIESARGMLYALWAGRLLPDRVLPSADGGVAFVFLSESDNRAAIESLNDEEKYLLLYDRTGNSRTIEWSDNSDSVREALRQLKAHIAGVPLATL